MPIDRGYPYDRCADGKSGRLARTLRQIELRHNRTRSVALAYERLPTAALLCTISWHSYRSMRHNTRASMKTTRLGENHPYKPVNAHFSFQYRNLEGT